MYVGWHMKTTLHTVTPETPVFKAREIMDHHKVSHLPVTDGKARLLGIVTDRALKEAWATPATTLSVHELTYVLQKLAVGNIMTKKITTATPNMSIERAAHIIHDQRIGALPVLKGDKLVGIITTTDLMEVLLMSLGLGEETKRLVLLVADRIDAMAKLTRIMQDEHVIISSTMTVPLRGYNDVWQVIVRLPLSDYKKAVSGLEAHNFKVLTDYVEDLAPFLPQRY